MQSNFFLFCIFMLAWQNSFSADANTTVSVAQNQITGSYIVIFKDPVGNEQPIVLPPDPNQVRSDNTPFNTDASTGQSKTALAKLLGINGTVMRIFETINAAQIAMTAEEAQRLSQDNRVKSLEPDRIISTANTELVTYKNPVYQDGILYLPVVDAPDQVGKYTDATFTLSKQGAWQLKEFRTLGGSVNFTLIEDAKLTITEALPKQVLLTVNGWYSPGCNSVGNNTVRFNNNSFSVVIPQTSLLTAEQLCSADVKAFQQIVVLPVFGLSAGTYTYDVNGKLSGNFSLNADNKLP